MGSSRDELVQDFTCFLCLSLRKPHQLCANGHTSCLECFHALKSSATSKCPQCRDPIFPVAHVALLALKMAETIDLRPCANAGCHVMFDLLDAKYYYAAAAHAAECEHATEACAFCAKRMVRRSLEGHVRSCDMRTMACVNPGCALTHQANQGAAHALVCLRRPVECKWKCGARLPFDEVEAHEGACDLRRVACLNQDAGCTAFFAGAEAMRSHLSACPHRTVQCGACDAALVWERVDAHNLVCPLRLVPCCAAAAGFSCAAAGIPVAEYARHVCDVHGFGAYRYGLGIDGFEVRGAVSEAFDLGPDGIVALRVRHLACGGVALSVFATSEKPAFGAFGVRVRVVSGTEPEDEVHGTSVSASVVASNAPSSTARQRQKELVLPFHALVALGAGTEEALARMIVEVDWSAAV